ncbi:hypothetical protein D7Y44_16795 [Stenotrophomonas maltophilia]|nr:hypothetical protein [Stenotrophomonas maltophilia]MBA0345948.1 hypothetical protein [Stenotrophomonas maltophilia]MBA0359089.1 hypothetical protein [Stenotrophomonas maltophilia]MBA0521176.1 hypothetical protein [Stenotrophomonas maltophilia]
MEGPRWPIRCGHVFTAEDLVRLREGLWPRDMDDRWAVHLEGNTLRCWRSWTGTCIYESLVTLSDDGTGVAVVVDVLDDGETYRRAATDEGELERFEGVLSQVRRRDSEADVHNQMLLMGTAVR